MVGDVEYEELYAGDTALTISEVRTVTREFEANAPITLGNDGPGCLNSNQGRLLKKTVEIRRPEGVVLKEVRKINQVQKDNPAFSAFNIILCDRTVTTYNYDAARVYSGRGTPEPDFEPLGRGPGITRERWVSRALLSADPYNDTYLARGTTTTIPPSPTERVLAEYQNQYWWQPTRSEWIYESKSRQSMGLFQGDVISRLIGALIADPGIVFSFDSFYTATPSENIKSRSTTGNQPPAADTLPASFDIDEFTGDATAELPIDGAWDYRDRYQSISFPFLTGSNREQLEGLCKRLANTWGAIAWGRYKGSQITCNLQDYFLNSYTPLAPIDVAEASLVTKNIFDGFTVAMSADGAGGGELLMSADTIYLGYTVLPESGVIQTFGVDDIRAIAPGDRYDGMVAYNA